jgi:hypothetical protein
MNIKATSSPSAHSRRSLEDLKKDKAAHEVDLNRRLVQKARALEEVSQRKLQMTEYQSQILINEDKLRQQQNLLEAVQDPHRTADGDARAQTQIPLLINSSETEQVRDRG